MDCYYVPGFSVRLAGLDLGADIASAITELSYDSSLDSADMFSFTLNNADLRLADSALFEVGKRVEVAMGYASDLHPMMLGEITAVNPSFPESGAPTVRVSGYDHSHRMRHNRKQRVFPHTNASAIAAQIAHEHNLIPVVDPSPVPFEHKTQRGSDMELLQELARRNHFEVFVRLDRLYFRAPPPEPAPLVLEWGRNLGSFNPRLSTSGLSGALSVHDYDQLQAEAILGSSTAAELDVGELAERLGARFVERLAGLDPQRIADETAGSFRDAQRLAEALLAESLEGLFEGHGSCIGLPELRAGASVEIAGVGKRFSGRYRLRSVTHSIGTGGYQTSFEVTQRRGSSLLQLLEKLVGGKQRKLSGPVVGKVINNVDSFGRVQVEYKGIGEGLISRLAPVAQRDVSSFSLPDRGDDVLVLFEQGDIDRPVVHGSLWNKGKAPPEEPRAPNHRKLFRSRGGQSILLDDDPDTGGVTISNSAGSRIRLHADGTVQVEAAGNLELRAGGDVTIRAENVQIAVAGTMDVTGP